MVTLQEISAEYREAAAKMLPQIQRYKEKLRGLSGGDAAALRSVLTKLEDTRRELLRLADCLGGYYDKKYVYGGKACFFSDVECYFAQFGRSKGGELL